MLKQLNLVECLKSLEKLFFFLYNEVVKCDISTPSSYPRDYTESHLAPQYMCTGHLTPQYMCTGQELCKQTTRTEDINLMALLYLDLSTSYF